MYKYILVLVVLAISCSANASTDFNTSWSIAQRWSINKNNVLVVPAHSTNNKRMGAILYLSKDTEKTYDFYFMYQDMKCNPKTFKNEDLFLNVDNMNMEFTAFCTPTKRIAYFTSNYKDNLTLFIKFMMQKSVTIGLTTYSTRGFTELVNKQLNQ